MLDTVIQRLDSAKADCAEDIDEVRTELKEIKVALQESYSSWTEVQTMRVKSKSYQRTRKESLKAYKDDLILLKNAAREYKRKKRQEMKKLKARRGAESSSSDIEL